MIIYKHCDAPNLLNNIFDIRIFPHILYNQINAVHNTRSPRQGWIPQDKQTANSHIISSVILYDLDNILQTYLLDEPIQ